MRRVSSFLRRLFRRADVEREMADELTFHIDARAADLMSRLGLSRTDAIRQARIEFGSVEKYKEDGAERLGTSPEEFRRFIAAEVPRWRKLVKELGIAP